MRARAEGAAVINAVVALGIWGFILLAYWIGGGIREYLQTRRWRAIEQRYVWLMPPPSVSDTPPRSVVVLGPGERVIPIPQVGGVRKPQVPDRGTCSHWSRHEVRLSDGTTVAYICRRCDHDWVNEQWVVAP